MQRLPAPIHIFAATLAVVFLCLVVPKGIQDSDHFWHLATGQLIAQGGQVPTSDPFSFTWAGQPWNSYSWLSQLALYRIVSWSGDVGALLAFAIAPAIGLGTLAITLTRQGIRAPAVVLPILLSAWTLLPYVTLRPQVVSWVLMTVLLSVLMSLTPKRAWLLFIPPAIIALWANLHGAWVLGLAVVGLYTLMTLLRRTPMSAARGRMLVVGAACVLVAAVTPAGPVGILYPLRYLDPSSWALEHIAEWQSPNFHDPTHWSVLLLIVALALNRGRATPGWLAVLPVIGVAMSLSSIRNVPILAIWAVPTLAFGLHDRLKVRGSRRQEQDGSPLVRRLLETGVGAVVIVAALATLFPTDLPARIADETQSRYPVEGIDRLEALNPDARVLAEYNWGGYVISRLYENGGRVFVDGRDGEMYSDAILDDYTNLVTAEPGWEELLAEYGVEAILLRPVVPLVNGLVQEAGWCEAYRDEKQVLLLHERCETVSP